MALGLGGSVKTSVEPACEGAPPNTELHCLPWLLPLGGCPLSSGSTLAPKVPPHSDNTSGQSLGSREPSSKPAGSSIRMLLPGS